MLRGLPLLRPAPAHPVLGQADIIFGCGPITQKYGGPEQEVIDAAVDAALHGGIVAFDTAPLCEQPAVTILPCALPTHTRQRSDLPRQRSDLPR